MSQNSVQDSLAKKEGRPKVDPLDKKRPRNLSISDRAWKSLQNIVKDLGLESVSELLEQTGQGHIRAISASSQVSYDSNIAMYERLKFFLRPPAVVAESLTLFVIRTIKQLGVDQVDLEELTCDILKKAFTIVLLFNVIYPEKYINNPSSYIRYLSYFILVKKYGEKFNDKSKNQDGYNQNLSNKVIEIDTCISKISYASDVLMTANLGNLAILRMKCYEGLSLVQIQRILSASGEELSIEEIIAKIKLAMAKIRECWHAAPASSNIKEHEINEVWYKTVRRYLELALQPSLALKNDQNDLTNNLDQANLSPIVDFWINEIDSYCGGNILVDCLDYGNLPEQIRVRLGNEIDSHFNKSLTKAEQGLLSCTTAESIENLLIKIVHEEADVDIPVQHLFSFREDGILLMSYIGNHDWRARFNHYVKTT